MEYLKKLLLKYQTVIRFGITGVIATLVNFAILFLLTDLVKIWYLASSMIAVSVSIVVNFFMQKLWAFKGDHSHSGQRQFALFILVNILNLIINSAGMYLMVEKLGLWYMFAQLILVLIIPIGSYFMYRFIVFKKVETNIDEKQYEITSPLD